MTVTKRTSEEENDQAKAVKDKEKSEAEENMGEVEEDMGEEEEDMEEEESCNLERPTPLAFTEKFKLSKTNSSIRMTNGSYELNWQSNLGYVNSDSNDKSGAFRINVMQPGKSNSSCIHREV